MGLYLPPVFNAKKFSSSPPQTIISLPLQTAVCLDRAAGAFVLLVAVQVSVPGLYLSPALNCMKVLSNPPQTIISLPVQTAV
jgi:hypothetical protein